MKTILTIAIALTSIVAQADGFRCEGMSTGTKITVYNKIQAADGTRNVAVMVVSNPAIAYPNKTIAKFSAANGTLASKGYGQYVGKVDLRFNDSARAGENVGGTKLGQLKTIGLNVNFSYANAAMLKDADQLHAHIVYQKRNGEKNIEKALCKRYTKN